MLEGHAVALDGVAFALEGGRERANGVGGGATKLRGEVGGDANEVVGLSGELVNRGTAVFELSTQERAQFLILVLCESDRCCGGVRKRFHLVGG